MLSCRLVNYIKENEQTGWGMTVAIKRPHTQLREIKVEQSVINERHLRLREASANEQLNNGMWIHKRSYHWGTGVCEAPLVVDILALRIQLILYYISNTALGLCWVFCYNRARG